MHALEIITTVNRQRDLEPEWADAANRDPCLTPFQTPVWLLTWWEHFGNGELRVMVFRHVGRVVGVIPLFLHEWNGRRQLTLLGSGITDYLDPLLAPDHAAEIIARLECELRSWRDWDVCDWQDLSAASPLLRLGESVEEAPCTCAPLLTAYDEYLRQRPKNLRRGLRSDRAKADAEAPVSFEPVNEADPQLVQALIDLHRARWQSAGEPGMIEANGAEAFLRAVAPRLAARDMLRFFVVRFAGQIAALILALRNRTTLYGYLTAYDPAHQDFGFGREVLAQAIRHGHECGYRSWDFLRGEEPYKFLWGAQRVERRRVLISR